MHISRVLGRGRGCFGVAVVYTTATPLRTSQRNIRVRRDIDGVCLGGCGGTLPPQPQLIVELCFCWEGVGGAEGVSWGEGAWW